jgi:hypothetical protein
MVDGDQAWWLCKEKERGKSTKGDGLLGRASLSNIPIMHYRYMTHSVTSFAARQPFSGGMLKSSRARISRDDFWHF